MRGVEGNEGKVWGRPGRRLGLVAAWLFACTSPVGTRLYNGESPMKSFKFVGACVLGDDSRIWGAWQSVENSNHFASISIFLLLSI